VSKLYSLLNSGSVLSLFLQVIPITLLVGVIYAVCRCIRIKKRGSTVSWGTEIMRWLFVCYLMGLINLILVPANLWMLIWENVFVGYSHSELVFFTGDFNLVPTVFKLIAGELTIGRWVLKMLIYNFLMFVPFGFFLPFVSEKINNRSIWKAAVIVPIVVEVIQPVVGRSFDVDDLILNFAGIIVGYFVAMGTQSLKRKSSPNI
jgi:glycopeptide antibiotics resistance protein